MRLPAPAALARFWQTLSAPRRPPMLPVVLLALETKKVMVLPGPLGPVAESLSPPQPAQAAASATPTMSVFMDGSLAQFKHQVSDCARTPSGIHRTRSR